jgi:hypothetical protein
LCPWNGLWLRDRGLGALTCDVCDCAGFEPGDVGSAESATREIVTERSMGRCEKCGNPGAQMHHRKNRSQGGLWSPSNIIFLCVEDHNWVGNNPVEAAVVGLHLLPEDDPASVPILTGDVPFLMDEDGGFTPVNPEDALWPLPGCLKQQLPPLKR